VHTSVLEKGKGGGGGLIKCGIIYSSVETWSPLYVHFTANEMPFSSDLLHHYIQNSFVFKSLKFDFGLVFLKMWV
jgi:hypothetical protein